MTWLYYRRKATIAHPRLAGLLRDVRKEPLPGRPTAILQSFEQMRLAYFTDTHDHFEAVPEAMARIGPIDLIVIGGDITSRGSAGDVARAIKLWEPLAPRLLVVAGNWDPPAIDDLLAGRRAALDSRGVVVGEVGLCGVSGSPLSVIRAPYELEEEEILRRLELGFAEIGSCPVRIVCPHTPPADTSCDRTYSGAHIGSSAVRTLVEARQPELVLCGHVHEARGFDRIGKTRIVNPGSARDGHYAVVQIEDGEIEVTLDG